MNEPSHTSSDPSGAREPGVPPRLLRGIHTVRRRLPKAKDFAELYECFDERVAQVPELWASSQLRDDPSLYSIVVAVATTCRPGFEPKGCRLYTVGDTGFWHGAIIGSNALACLFYDEPVGLGLAAVSNPFDGTGYTHFVRFTRVPVGSPSEAGTRPEHLPC